MNSSGKITDDKMPQQIKYLALSSIAFTVTLFGQFSFLSMKSSGSNFASGRLVTGCREAER